MYVKDDFLLNNEVLPFLFIFVSKNTKENQVQIWNTFFYFTTFLKTQMLLLRPPQTYPIFGGVV